jgi:hypothetical protein
MFMQFGKHKYWHEFKKLHSKSEYLVNVKIHLFKSVVANYIPI